MSTLSNPSISKIENDNAKSIDDLLSHFNKKISISKTFSNSSLSNLKQEAKKLKKNSSLGYKEHLNAVAIKKGFTSFKDFSNKFKYWENLSPSYIYISKNETVSYTKEVYDRLPKDDKSKSMKELMKDYNIDRLNKLESSSVPISPVSILDNHKLGIKLLNQSDKEVFFDVNKHMKHLSLIDKESDFLFKFIYYKFDPIEEKKIRLDLEESSKKHNYKLSESEVTDRIINLVDNQLHALLTIEKYTENTYVHESYIIYPNAYIINHRYFTAVDLHDAPFDQFGPITDSDY